MIVSLLNPSYFWMSTYGYRGPFWLRYFHVDDEKLVVKDGYLIPGMIRKNGKVFFEYGDGFMYRETKGCDSECMPRHIWILLLVRCAQIGFLMK